MTFVMDMASDSRRVLDKAIAVYGKPEAVLRYLPVFPVTPDEIVSIHARSMSLGALWNGDQYGAVIGSNNAAMGAAEAGRAVAAWKALGLPPGCTIIFDVETSFLFTAPVAIGIIETVHAGGYVPGFYLNPPNGRNHAAGYQEARKATQSIPCVHFSCQTCLNDYKPHSSFVIGDYPNARAVPGYEAECIGQQTSIQTYDVDLDVFKDLSLFWPVKKLVWSVRTDCDLKQEPNHDPGTVARLKAGALVEPDPPITTHWVHVHTSHYSGWILGENLTHT
jgi:hypothetical protein